MEKAATKTHKLDNMIESGNLTINQSRLEITVDSNVVALKPKEYELLLYFARHRGQVMSRDNILERV
jgi:two-component system OmpR family response regulator